MIAVKEMNSSLRMKEISFFFLLFLFTGCGFVYSEKINDKYSIFAVDTLSGASVSRVYPDGSNEGAINYNVKKVGLNRGFIFAQKADLTYWSIDLSNDKVEGPFNKKELMVKIGESKLKFKWHVED